MLVYFVENENPLRDSTGGIMSYISDLSEYLMKRQSHTVLLGSGECSRKKISFSEFIPVNRNSDSSNAAYFLSLFIKMAALDIDPDAIIHAQRPDMLFPFILSGKKNVMICTLHGAHDLAVYDKKGSLFGHTYEFFQKKSFRKADTLIAVNQGTKDHYLEKYPWLDDKISVIPVGVDLKRFLPLDKDKLRAKYHFNQEDKIVIFIGRIEKEKNLPMLIEAFRRIKKSLPKAKLVLAGNGREESSLKRKIFKLQIRDILFIGEVEKEKVPELLNCADVFAFCSLYEGSPTVIREALACNLPVVSVDVGDVKEMIRDIEGCYVVKRNIDDFSAHILKALRNGKRTQSREKVVRYSIENVGLRTWEIYRSLSARKWL
jgi:glycosyltransferase involved in cell wall biosynthesis